MISHRGYFLENQFKNSVTQLTFPISAGLKTGSPSPFLRLCVLSSSSVRIIKTFFVSEPSSSCRSIKSEVMIYAMCTIYWAFMSIQRSTYLESILINVNLHRFDLFSSFYFVLCRFSLFSVFVFPIQFDNAEYHGSLNHHTHLKISIYQEWSRNGLMMGLPGM